METIGQRIRKLRDIKAEEDGHCTQAELGAALGVTQNTVQKWEHDMICLNSDKIVALADYFDVSCDYLLSRIKAKNHDIQFICDYTGLSEESIEKLHSVYFDKQSKDLISHLIMEYGETYHDIYSYTSTAIDSQALANNNVALSGNAWLTNHLASRGVRTKNAPNIDGYEIISAKEALDFKLSEAARVFREFIKAFVAKKATEIKPIPSREAESRNRADKSFMDTWMDKMDKLKEIPKK